MLATNTLDDAAVLRQAVLYRRPHVTDPVPFSFACFGKPANWSLAPLQKAEDAAKNPELCDRIAGVCQALQVKRVYAPSPVTFNAEFVSPSRLAYHIPLAPGVGLYRNKGLPADVSTLNREGDAGCFSGAGCLYIVATIRNEMVFAHGGRDCLLDAERFMPSDEKKPRLNESVVDTMMHALRGSQEPGEVRAWIFGALPRRSYLHPLSGPWAKKNKAMYAYVAQVWGAQACAESMPQKDGNIMLDLPRLARAQFESWHVPRENIYLQHAYLPKQGVWLDGTKGGPRNLFIAVRHR